MKISLFARRLKKLEANMKIAVIGLGYVGLSLAVLLAQNNEVKAVDIVKEKVDLVNKRQSPIVDKYISEYLLKPNLQIKATTNINGLFGWADFVIIATPTNYNPETNHFDTSSIEGVLNNFSKAKSKATIVIKSTIPIGYTLKMKKKFGLSSILFSPEFLREGKALEDNLFPSRIIVGLTDSTKELEEKALAFGNLLNNASIKKTTVIVMKSTEAEAVKLFANTYLATRVAFFNELDTYAEINGLDSSKIIHGVCSDPRIGDFYNNPSFGYGGYCLPKDTKQLKAEFKNVPNCIIDATVDANLVRCKHIANSVLDLAHHLSSTPIIGIYRLIMKADSDNFRSSSIQNVISVLEESNVRLIVYEPSLNSLCFNGLEVVNDFKKFSSMSDLIIANRKDDLLSTLPREKIYTRDIYGKN